MATQNTLAAAIDLRIHRALEVALGDKLAKLVEGIVEPIVAQQIARMEHRLLEPLLGAGYTVKRGPGRPPKSAAVTVSVASKPAAAAKVAPKQLAKAKPGKPGRPKQFVSADGNPSACSVAGCGRDYRSKGYCSAHYQAARKNGWPVPAPSSNWTPPAKK